MKRMLMLICSLYTGLIFSEQVIVSCKKTYVTPPQMHIAEEGLLLSVDDVWVMPASLQIDANGYYFTSIRFDQRMPGPWQCRRSGCLTWNEEWRGYCKQCGMSK